MPLSFAAKLASDSMEGVGQLFATIVIGFPLLFGAGVFVGWLIWGGVL